MNIKIGDIIKFEYSYSKNHYGKVFRIVEFKDSIHEKEKHGELLYFVNNINKDYEVTEVESYDVLEIYKINPIKDADVNE